MLFFDILLFYFAYIIASKSTNLAVGTPFKEHFWTFLEAHNLLKERNTALFLQKCIVCMLYNAMVKIEAYAVDTFNVAKSQKQQNFKLLTVKNHIQTSNRHISGTIQDIGKIFSALSLFLKALCEKSHLKDLL